MSLRIRVCVVCRLVLFAAAALLAAPPGRGEDIQASADCGRRGKLQVFQIRVPAEVLGVAEPYSLYVRPSAGSEDKVRLLHVDLSGRPAPGVRKIDPAALEEDAAIEKLNKELWAPGKSEWDLGKEIEGLKTLKLDPKTPAQLAATIDGRIRDLESEAKSLAAHREKLSKEIAEHQARKDKLAAEAESRAASAPAGEAVIEGVYGPAAPVRLDVLHYQRNGEVRALRAVSASLDDDPPEKPDLIRSWAGNHAWRLLSRTRAGGSQDFHVYTARRLAKRFELGLSDAELRSMRDEADRSQPRADLYSVTTGALAIEESLQLEVRLRPGPGDTPVSVASLSGPRIQSHPFKEMLGGRTPRLFTADSLVPADNWYAHFSTIGAEIRLSDLLDQWGTSFLQGIEVSSRDRKLKEKLLGQLAIDLSVLTRLFGDFVIGELALTGSDPFLHDGSDVAIILQVKSRPVFQAQMDRYREEAKGRRADAKDSTETYEGVKISILATDDRRVSSHSCDLGDFRVYANSARALRRIIDAQAGRIPCLRDAEDYRYMRTIFPGEAAAEDGFVYLSDPFIRNVVGPVQKIQRARQLRCGASLRRLQFAIIEARLEETGWPGGSPALEDLFAEGYASADDIACPSGGTYRIAGGHGGTEAVCSVHNRLRFGTPLVDLPLETATGPEASGYREFVSSYESYWSRYFDPVGMRFLIDRGPAGRIETETCILPLIENSIYDGVRRAVGGKPVEIPSADVPRAIGSLGLKLVKDWKELRGFLRDLSGEDGVFTVREMQEIVETIGDGVTLTLHDADLLFTFSGEHARENLGFGGSIGGEDVLVALILSAITLPLSMTVDVKDPEKARGLLDGALRRWSWKIASGDTWEQRELGIDLTGLEPYKGVPIGLVTFRFFFVNFQVHYATIGNRLVAATQRWIITDVIDASRAAVEAGRDSPPAAAPREPANLVFEVRPERFQRTAAALGIEWQARMRMACLSNLPVEEVLDDLPGAGRGGPQREEARLALFGYVPFCPAGGSYGEDPKTGIHACSVHGFVWSPRQPLEARGDEPFIRFLETLKTVRASFRFTDEGIRTKVSIERNAAGK